MDDFDVSTAGSSDLNPAQTTPTTNKISTHPGNSKDEPKTILDDCKRKIW